MRKFNAYYYLLFILLITGAFASMAQNSYGLKIMGGVAFAFGLLFMVDFLFQIMKSGRKDFYILAEALCLFVLSVIFGLRIFYIYFDFVEILFAAAGVVLVLIYARRLILRFRQAQVRNKVLATLLFVFYSSLILFLVSLILVPFAAKSGEMAGISAFILLLIFVIFAFQKKQLLVEGESTSAFKTVARFKDYSIIIVSVFVLFALYVGFNKFGLIPPIYTDEFPQAYYKMVNEATSRKVKSIDGKYKYEEFMEKYKQFLKQKNPRDL